VPRNNERGERAEIEVRNSSTVSKGLKMTKLPGYRGENDALLQMLI
jgi:hypothetical protein